MVRGMLRFARKGKAMDSEEARIVIAKRANDGKAESYAKGLPSHALMLSFRARHPEISYRGSVSQDPANLKAEIYDHVNTYAKASSEIFAKHPSLQHNPKGKINIDETSVDTEFWKKVKVYCSREGGRGGRKIGSKSGFHVILIIAANNAG